MILRSRMVYGKMYNLRKLYTTCTDPDWVSGPSCSKLIWKNVSSFCSAKATHIFSAKNFRILYIESAKTVNEMTLNELVKLTTLWTTGPRLPDQGLHMAGQSLSRNTTYAYALAICFSWHFCHQPLWLSQMPIRPMMIRTL